MCVNYVVLFLIEPAHLFHYTSQGGDTHIDGVCDRSSFSSLSTSLAHLGITSDQQLNLYSILSAILHIGDIVIQTDTHTHASEGSSVADNDPVLLVAADLLGVSKEKLCHWLCHQQIVTARETLTSPLSTDKVRLYFILCSNSTLL